MTQFTLVKRLFALTAVGFCISLNAHASQLACKSFEKVDGKGAGVSAFDYVTYTAGVESATRLTNANIQGAFKSDVRDLVADASGARFDRVRFQTLEDAWCWFNLLLPKDFAGQQGQFRGAIQYSCEGDSSFRYIDMACQLN